MSSTKERLQRQIQHEGRNAENVALERLFFAMLQHGEGQNAWNACTTVHWVNGEKRYKPQPWLLSFVYKFLED